MGWHLQELPNPIITFPVKHNWWEKADIDLIVKSCMQLNKCINENGFDKVYLPRPGCGNGQLSWETDVKPVISEVLLKKVIIVWK